MDERTPTEDEMRGIAWWNSLTDTERKAWLARAGSAIPAAAWAAYQRTQAPPYRQ
jgi:hypothetical protein